MKHKRATHHRTAQPKPLAPDLTFSAKEFHHYPKNTYWFIGIGLLGFALLVIFYRQAEYLLMAVVVAVVAAMFRLAPVEPSTREVRLTERGLYWGQEFFPYFKLRAFWVADSAGNAGIYIERLNFAPPIHFIVPLNRLEELAGFLAEYLPFHAHKDEPLGDKVSRWLRL